MAETAGIINGTDFLIYVDGTAILHTTTHSLNLNMATLDASTKDDAGWARSKPGRRSWDASGSGMYTFDDAYTHSDLMALITNRTLVTVKLSTENAGDKYFSGSGYLNNLTLDAPGEENSTYSFSFTGDGALTEYTGT